MKPLRIVIADDHTLVRAGLRLLIQEQPGFAVVAEAADGREALRLVATHRPHVVVMDVTMPEMNGLEAIERLVRAHPSIGVVVLSVHAEAEYVTLALRAGARGYLLKHAAASELELAIRAVAQGDMYLSKAIASSVVAPYAAQSHDERNALTQRQREIVQLIAEGRTSRQIARRLGLSYRTVEAHRAQLMRRLAVHDIAGLVRWAIRYHVVPEDE